MSPALHFYSHPDCELHDMGAGHPESPARLRAIMQMLDASSLAPRIKRCTAPLIHTNCLHSVHPQHFVDALLEASPKTGIISVDADTHLNRYSLNAARRAAGAALAATDAVLASVTDRAFCAVRPPGHHAESTIAMGFCLFNSVALAAQRALDSGCSRVTILDFDVHHGNGTVEIFKDRPEVMVCSSFQFPFYPGRFDDIERDNIILTPLKAGTDSVAFRRAIDDSWRPALLRHQPDIIFVSAGFDAHREDPLGGLNFEDDDFAWISQWICDIAGEHANSRVVSLLEGGYDLHALARSVKVYLEGMLC